MKNKRREGMIAPFVAVSFLLVASLVLLLLEGTRLGYAEAVCMQQARYAAQSFMGQYHVNLFKQFGVYGVDEHLYEEKERILTDMGQFRTGKQGGSFLNPISHDTEEFSYRLLTDDGGLDFRKQAIQDYLYRLPEGALAKLNSQLSVAAILGDQDDERAIINQAEGALKEAEEILKEEKNNKNSHNIAGFPAIGTDSGLEFLGGRKKQEKAENPIEIMKKQKQSFTLSMVLPENFNLSMATRIKNQGLEDKEPVIGTMEAEDDVISGERLIFPLYIRDDFFNALTEHSSDETGNGLQYQMEYVLIGKDSDAKNLEGVVQRLILIREMSWFAYRLTDGTSLPYARSIATALAGGLGLPALIEPIAMGIVLAWSYTDGVNDVKELLKGNEVMLMPGAQNINRPGVPGNIKVGYRDYLTMLIAMENMDKATLRTLDMVEEVLQVEDPDFSANRVITGIEGCIKYEYEELFFGWITVVRRDLFPIEFQSKYRECYCE